MSDTHHELGPTPSGQSDAPLVAEPPLADMEPVDPLGDVEWYEDGGRKAALGAWAGVAVISYAAMQLTGYFADWPFVALVSGAVGYFCVRGVAVVLAELKRRSDRA
ncbi:MAG: hypothetical protein ACFB0Z_05145 [Candidatus Phaeomarinobacter sp.]